MQRTASFILFIVLLATNLVPMANPVDASQDSNPPSSGLSLEGVSVDPPIQEIGASEAEASNVDDAAMVSEPEIPSALPALLSSKTSLQGELTDPAMTVEQAGLAAQDVPSDWGLNLRIKPSVIIPSGKFVMEWAIQAADKKDLPSGLVLSITVPQGISPVDEKAGKFSPLEGKLTLPVEDHQGTIEWAAMEISGDSATLLGELYQGKNALTQASLTVDVTAGTRIGKGGGEARGLSGKWTLHCIPPQSSTRITALEFASNAR